MRPLLSCPKFCFSRQTDICRTEHRVSSSFALAGIVLQSLQSGPGQNHNHRQVDQGHHAHQHIRQVPYHVDLHARTDENQHHSVNAEKDHELLGWNLPHDIVQAVVHIIQVPDQSGEGK